MSTGIEVLSDCKFSMPAEVCGLAPMLSHLERMTAYVKRQVERMARELRKLVSLFLGQDTDKKGPPSTGRRDKLLEWQCKYQKEWEKEKVFEADAPAEGTRLYQTFQRDKYRWFLLCTCPMFGSLLATEEVSQSQWSMQAKRSQRSSMATSRTRT